MTSHDISFEAIEAKVAEIENAFSFLRDPHIGTALDVITALRARLAEVEEERDRAREALCDQTENARNALARLAEMEKVLRKARVTWVEVSEIDAALASAGEEVERAILDPEREPIFWLRKGGYYYRPNAQGYTTREYEAGLYSESDAKAHVASCSGEVTMHPAIRPLDLAKRPVCYRVAAHGNWLYFDDEEMAQGSAEMHGVDYQGLYVRNGRPLTERLILDPEIYSWAKVQHVPATSVVNGGTMLLAADGRCIALVTSINVLTGTDRQKLTAEITQALCRALQAARNGEAEAQARATELEQALRRCRTVLGNMAEEREGAIFNRWPINHEPLRADARRLLPVIDAALEDKP